MPFILGALGTAIAAYVGYWILVTVVVVGVIGAPVTYLDKKTGLHIITEDISKMTITPVSVQWGDGGKTVTLKVTNNSGEAWDRFRMVCKADTGGWVEPSDMSGIMPGETSIRTYVVKFDTTVTKVSNCELVAHMRGKPKPFDHASEFDRVGGGGWGDRLPATASDDIAGLDDGLDPNIDYD